jgi:hypothetical protein
MNKRDQSSGGQHTWARRDGLFAGACSAVVAAAGVDDLVQASQRNIGQGVLFLGLSLFGFYIAGRMLWTYRRLRKGLGLTRRGLDNLALLDHPDRQDWMRPFYLGLGAGAAGVSAAWQGGEFFAGSDPDREVWEPSPSASRSFASRSPDTAGRQYRNKRSQALRDQL